MICRNCGLPIEPLYGMNGEDIGWHHSTLAKEVNFDGRIYMTPVTFCPDNKGEAEPEPLTIKRNDEWKDILL